jgi:hypothetical protein
MDPITWWGFHGGDTIHLSILATRLLSQVASSSSVEFLISGEELEYIWIHPFGEAKHIERNEG